MSDWVQWTPIPGQYTGPLEDHIWCEILMVDGEKDQSFALNFDWGVVDEPGEIVAYRVSEIQEAPEEFIEILDNNMDEVLA